jgi:hypothetical protein
MRNRLILGTLILLSGACHKASDTSVPDPAYYRQQEARVIVDLFDEIITVHRQTTPPRPGAADTLATPLYVADSLFGSKSQWHYQRRIGSNRAASAAQKRLITTLTDSLTESVSLPSQLTVLLKQHNFHSMAARLAAHFPEPSTGIGLSRVIFNRDFTEACFVHSLTCGGDCGEGTLIFVGKQKGRWVITQRLRLWIA